MPLVFRRQSYSFMGLSKKKQLYNNDNNPALIFYNFSEMQYLSNLKQAWNSKIWVYSVDFSKVIYDPSF